MGERGNGFAREVMEGGGRGRRKRGRGRVGGRGREGKWGRGRRRGKVWEKVEGVRGRGRGRSKRKDGKKERVSKGEEAEERGAVLEVDRVN